MNQTQVNNFLLCLSQINDLNYMALHDRARAAYNGMGVNSTGGATHHHQPVFGGARLAQDDGHDDEHGHDHDHDHDDDGLLVAKITAMLVLFVATTLCGSIPFMLNRCFKWTDNNASPRSAIVVKCLLYFGGGVLLCTTFLHLLPEVQETVEQLQECGTLPQLSFALAELLMCFGFFLMYLIEESIHAYIHHHRRKLLEKDAGAGAAFERGHSVRNSHLVKGGAAPKRNGSLANGDGMEKDSNAFQMPQTMEKYSKTDENLSSLRHSKIGNAQPAALSVQDLVSNDLENQKYQEQQQPQHVHHHDHHGHSHMPTEDAMVTSSLRGLFIVLALSLHELFEGMAIGLEGSTNSVWFMFGAVSAHKLVLAFCVGVELIVARTRRSLSVVYVLTFAIVSPIGIGVGILISHNSSSSASSLPSAFLQGIACGTLLYVVFFEILSKNHVGLVPYLALFVGFALMFGLQQLGDDDHSHSHGECGTSSDNDSNANTVRAATVSRSSGIGATPEQPNSKDDGFVQHLQMLRMVSQKLMAEHKKAN